MTKSQRVENLTAGIVLLSVAASIWKPQLGWLNWVAVVVLLAGVVLAIALRTDIDRERARKATWLIPVSASAIAAQWIYFADPAERMRNVVLGLCLVLAATALAMIRRRAT